MGCGVNGPGEAKEADLGIVGGKDQCLFYKKGEIIEKITQDQIINKILLTKVSTVPITQTMK